jgi:hypothetical protein
MMLYLSQKVIKMELNIEQQARGTRIIISSMINWLLWKAG